MENSFLNGACSGIVGITLSHPFDTIKSNIQNNTSTRYNLRNLYKGFIPPLIGVGFEKAIVFGVYTNVSNYLKEQNDITKNTISGGLAGLSASLIVTPVERIKILYQTNNKTNIFNPKYLFHGLNATFTRETPGFAIYFNVYNYLKNTTGRNDLLSCFLYGGVIKEEKV